MTVPRRRLRRRLIDAAAQQIVDAMTRGSLSSVPGRLEYFALAKLRGLLVGLDDPTVSCPLGGRTVALPLSHELPYALHFHTSYMANLVRAAEEVQRKYPGASAIDVGANVGDSAIALRERLAGPILCIEGADEFLGLLDRNVEGLGEVVVERTFLGSSVERHAGSLIADRGTVQLTLDGGGGHEIELSTLDEVLKRHLRFAEAKLLKIDTDGFDCRVLRGAGDLLGRARPMIFFEYDPDLLERVGDSGIETLDWLASKGYERVAVYENTGEFLVMLDLRDREALRDLDAYYSGRASARYCDLCVFHAQDEGVAETLRRRERGHRRSAIGRGISAAPSA